MTESWNPRTMDDDDRDDLWETGGSPLPKLRPDPQPQPKKPRPDESLKLRQFPDY